jgi:hypothetical protein
MTYAIGFVSRTEIASCVLACDASDASAGGDKYYDSSSRQVQTGDQPVKLEPALCSESDAP